MLQLGHVHSDMVSRGGRKGYADLLTASIGPCPFSHGKDGILGADHRPALASIGPRPFRHGKDPSPLTCCGTPMLQLGHVHSDMVSATGAVRSVLNNIMLQLGHVHSDMVSLRIMKALSIRRMLQLGHVHSDMVRWRAAGRLRTCRPSFNWAMSIQTW